MAMHACRTGRRRRCTPEIGFCSRPVDARRVAANSLLHPSRGSNCLWWLAATRTRGRNSPRKPRVTRFPAAHWSGVCAGAAGPV